MSDVLARLHTALGDRYLIEKEIGQGGMATVYLARDLKHGRPVALKVLRPEWSAALGSERFLHEIQLTAHLRHPHILPLHDSGAAGDLLYYVMPFVAGESLRHKLRRERQLSVEQSVAIAVQVATALEYAHGQGLIHRDIKPENILLESGQAVVADFGIALALRSAGGKRLTETGLSFGTPQYMSPEQAAGDRELDARSDVYSLACVAYEMLAGEPPHSAPTVQAVLTRVMTETPRSLTEVRRTVPTHVAAAVEQGLEKLPADRFATAAQFAAALEGRAGAVPVKRPRRDAAATSGLSRWKRLALALGALLLLAFGALLNRVFSGRNSEEALPRWSIALPDSAPLVFVGAATYATGLPAITVSPDDRSVVYVGKRSAGTALYLHDVGTFGTRLLPGTEGAFHPFFSPDGREVAFFTEGKLKKIAAAGGAPTILADVYTPFGGVWREPDRIIVADRGGTRLSTVAAAGGNPTTLGVRLTGIQSPSPIPDSPWLLHAIPSSTGILAVTSTVSGETRYLRRRGPSSSSASGPDILHGTRPMYVAGYLVHVAPTENRLLARRFDPRTLEVTGDAFPVLEGVRVEYSGAQTGIGGGVLAYATGADARTGQLVWAGPGKILDTLPIPAGTFGDFDISPDGGRLAFTIGTTDGPPELQVLDFADLGRGPLERRRLQPGSPIVKWAPDGQWIALSEAVGYDRAWAYRLTLPFGSTRDTLSDNFVVGPFTPDGRSMVGLTIDSNGIDLARLSLHDGVVTRLRSQPESQIFPALSPRGDRLAYLSDETGNWEVYVEPFPEMDSRQKVSIAGGDEPLWSPSGDRLYYRYRNAWYVAVVDKFTGTVGAPTEFVTGPFVNSAGNSYRVSPDGNRLLMIRGPAEETANHIRVIRDFAAEIRRAEGRQ